jgi:hypothetical protein
MMDVVQGNAPRNLSGGYGEVTIKAKPMPSQSFRP